MTHEDESNLLWSRRQEQHKPAWISIRNLTPVRCTLPWCSVAPVLRWGRRPSLLFLSLHRPTRPFKRCQDSGHVCDRPENKNVLPSAYDSSPSESQDSSHTHTHALVWGVFFLTPLMPCDVTDSVPVFYGGCPVSSLCHWCIFTPMTQFVGGWKTEVYSSGIETLTLCL